MKSPALQDLISKVFGDREIREQFIADPESVISQFDLTEEEKKAVLTRTRLALETGNSTQFETTIGPLDMWL
jgi:hypothetical protein